MPSYDYPARDYYERLGAGEFLDKMIPPAPGIPRIPTTGPPDYSQYDRPLGPFATAQYDAPLGPYPMAQAESPLGPHYVAQSPTPLGPYAVSQAESPLGPHATSQYQAPSGPYQVAQSPQPLGPQIDLSQPIPESRPLITAVETGYADKKVMGPVDMIRRGVQVNDMDMVDKGHTKLVAALTNHMSFGERFGDAYLGTGIMTRARKMAADLVMSEMTRPRAIHAIQSGLLSPAELMPGEQVVPSYGHLIPAEPLDRGEPQSTVEMRSTPAQPGQEPSLSISPEALVNPLQQELIQARLSAMEKRTGGQGHGPTATDIALLGIQAQRDAYRQNNNLTAGTPLPPDVDAEIISRWAGLAQKEDLAIIKQNLADVQQQLLRSTAGMRDEYGNRARVEADQVMPARVEMYKSRAALDRARTELTKKQPELQKALRALAAPQQALIAEAFHNVKKALNDGTQPDAMDMAVVQRFLRGTAPYAADFSGRIYNRLEGYRVDPNTGKPMPPDNEAAGLDIFQWLKDFITHASEQLKEDLSTQKGLPHPKTPEDAAKLKPGTRYVDPDGKEWVR